MKANVKPNKEYYSFNSSVDIENNSEKVISVVKEYLKKESSADKDELKNMFEDIENNENNFVCRFDNDTEMKLDSQEGETRVAYGAFRHEAPVHSIQPSWSYTFQIFHTEDEYYMSIRSWSWESETDIERKVSTMLE